MSQPEKPNKRIVSKAEYVASVSKKVTLHLIGGGLTGTGALLGCISILTFVYVFVIMFLSGYFKLANIVLVLTFAIVVGTMIGLMVFGFVRSGLSIIETASQITPVLPQTRANTGDLPASESLVRASSEPVEEQESVLLRASIQSQQTPAEQLLRSVEE